MDTFSGLGPLGFLSLMQLMITVIHFCQDVLDHLDLFAGVDKILDHKPIGPLFDERLGLVISYLG
jgi:hypothetical protein